MAVKERKQITGTTAQINVYKGHEGQIVWDKEKKTLVGMSGTAGKNYPLAPKEYVDNEVAKKQPKGDYATNAKLTEGLAGKEDKGTCLPLTGGTLTGDTPTISSSNSYIAFIERPTDRGLAIHTHNKAPLENPLLLLRAKEATFPDAGQFVLNAVTKNKVTYSLRGDPSNGVLSWDNRAIDTVAKGSMAQCIQYQETGLQICWGVAQIPASGVLVFNFQNPFRDAGYCVYTQIIGIESAASINYNILVEPVSPSSAKLTGIVGNHLGQLGLFWMAIGYWRF